MSWLVIHRMAWKDPRKWLFEAEENWGSSFEGTDRRLSGTDTSLPVRAVIVMRPTTRGCHLPILTDGLCQIEKGFFHVGGQRPTVRGLVNGVWEIFQPCPPLAEPSSLISCHHCLCSFPPWLYFGFHELLAVPWMSCVFPPMSLWTRAAGEACMKVVTRALEWVEMGWEDLKRCREVTKTSTSLKEVESFLKAEITNSIASCPLPNPPWPGVKHVKQILKWSKYNCTESYSQKILSGLLGYFGRGLILNQNENQSTTVAEMSYFFIQLHQYLLVIYCVPGTLGLLWQLKSLLPIGKDWKITQLLENCKRWWGRVASSRKAFKRVDA